MNAAMLSLRVLLLSLFCCSRYFGLALALPHLTGRLVHMVHVHKGRATEPSTAMYYCAVESAMQHLGRDATIVIWTASVTNTCHDLKRAMNRSSCNIDTVRIESLEYKVLFKNTPFHSWYPKLDQTQQLYQQNLGNAVRLALLYWYGGVYVDSDLIVYNSRIMQLTKPTFATQQCDATACIVNNAFMSFPSRKQQMLWHIMERFVSEFKWIWGHNGPYLLTRWWNSNCRGKQQARYCSSVKMLPMRFIYPVRHEEALWILNQPNETHTSEDGRKVRHDLQDIISSSWAYHLWNSRLATAGKRFCVSPGCNLERLMQMSCPTALEGLGDIVNCQFTHRTQQQQKSTRAREQQQQSKHKNTNSRFPQKSTVPQKKSTVPQTHAQFGFKKPKRSNPTLPHAKPKTAKKSR